MQKCLFWHQIWSFMAMVEHLEYDFVVHPGVDPNQIEFSIKGETSANLEESGGLALATHVGTIHFRAPVIYQQDGDLRHNIDGHFQLVGAQHGEKKLSFVLDPLRPFSYFGHRPRSRLFHLSRWRKRRRLGRRSCG